MRFAILQANSYGDRIYPSEKYAPDVKHFEDWFESKKRFTSTFFGAHFVPITVSFFTFSNSECACALGLVAEPASLAKAGCLSGPAGLGGITSLVIIPEIETSKLNIRLQSTVSLSIQAKSTDYSKIYCALFSEVYSVTIRTGLKLSSCCRFHWKYDKIWYS